MVKSIVCILAAGKSERFGSMKLLAEYKSKKIIHWVFEAVNSEEDIFLITGAFHNELKETFPSEKIKFIKNENFELGQHTSARLALETAKHMNKSLILVLGDTPLLKPEKFKEFCASISNEVIFSRDKEANLAPPCFIPLEKIDEALKQDFKSLKSCFPQAKSFLWPEAFYDVDRPRDLRSEPFS